MDKRTLSCFINHLTGGNPTEMFCCRVFIQSRMRGGFWVLLERAINWMFYQLRGQHNHVRATYLLQRRYKQCPRQKTEKKD